MGQWSGRAICGREEFNRQRECFLSDECGGGTIQGTGLIVFEYIIIFYTYTTIFL